MGLFDFITGNRAADPLVPRIARDELYHRLLAVTEPSGVWHVQPVQDEGRADLVAEWHRSANWDRIFGTAGSRTAFRILMRLVEEDAAVRTLDHETSVSWETGMTALSFGATGLRGQKVTTGATWTFGRKDDGSFGKIDEEHHGTGAIKKILHKIVADAGWAWHGVTIGKL
jgi:hypothetical protein